VILDTCPLVPAYRTNLPVPRTPFKAFDVISGHVVIRAASGSRRSFDLVCWAPNQHRVCSPLSMDAPPLRLEYSSGGFAVAVAAHIVRLQTARLGAARDDRDARSVGSGPMCFLEMKERLSLDSDSPAVRSPCTVLHLNDQHLRCQDRSTYLSSKPSSLRRVEDAYLDDT
jgi:hypothetical protein